MSFYIFLTTRDQPFGLTPFPCFDPILFCHEKMSQRTSKCCTHDSMNSNYSMKVTETM